MSSGNAFELNAVGASGSRSGASVVVKNKGHLFLVHRMKQFWDHFMADGERQFLPFTYVAAYVPNSVDKQNLKKQRSVMAILYRPERMTPDPHRSPHDLQQYLSQTTSVRNIASGDAI
ncbi:unnamed protein product [Toxocara canis]|uniref:Uncharacterized protein n=1 Tax=Toxocara canis TaxID=6265 RepID=A0A183U3W6_TOXCA|nr:unnamed protein product [Toxocara canis]